MSNEAIQGKERVKSLAEADVKKKLVNNKWRRICSVDKCDKQAQRKSLCARHLTEYKNRQQSTETIAVSHQSSISLPTTGSSIISYNPTNVVSATECDKVQNTFLGHDSTQTTTIQVHSSEQNIMIPSVPKQSASSCDNIVSIGQMNASNSSIAIMSSGTSTETLHQTTENQNKETNMKICAYRFPMADASQCRTTARYQCSHCPSSFCLKHGSQHQQDVKEDLNHLLNKAK
ncbi:unnamed protein product, partial [Rotaria sp. Silwood2]